MTRYPIDPRPCPICSSSNKEVIYFQRFFGLTDVALFDGYDVVVCSDCGLGYADDLPPQEAFNTYYRDLSKYENQTPGFTLSAYDSKRFAETVALIADVLEDRAIRILEIGCSTGGLLEALIGGGYRRVVGLDPSPVCTGISNERCGAEVITGSLSDLKPELGPFGLIILGSVLEHLRDTDMAMTILKSLLTQKGYLYLEVPDASRFPEGTQASFQEFSLEHITYFSPRSLDNLLGAHGFHRVFCHQGNPEPHPGILAVEIKALYQLTGHITAPMFDPDTRPALEAYVGKSQSQENHLEAILFDLAESKRPILVWGVGTHTQHLLTSGALARARIVAFVDSNPNYHGHTLKDVPILAPMELGPYTEPILISSQQFQEEIVEQIMFSLGLKNEIIRLYGSTSSR